ncbi:MAG: T9SS type A sorting domain-containing protein, partial [Ignavibacteriales bacterium]|nr:T9SS type A sorting domain-containing protein [Ignavibacteriales bacterium]
ARITCIVREGENPVNAVQLFYRVNYGVFQPLSMAATSGDTLYEAVIPQQSVNSFVNYFIKVADDNDSVTILASSATDGSQLDTSKGFFFYTVLNRALTIADIQYTPFLNGRSGYIGAVIPVSGFVTADTAHLRSTPLTGGGTSTWYIQDSSTAWNGIWVVGAESLLASTKNNDNITVTGTIQEQFSVTRIGAVSNVVINSTGNPLRNPISLTTGTFGPSVGNGNPIAEPFEGGLVALDSVTVTNVFPTFADPTEYEVDDGTGPIIVRRDGKNTYSNVEADTIFGYTILRQGDKIGRLVGVMYFANNRYKIVPRTNSDFIDVMHVGVLEREQTLPEGFVLHQNYPNPFNPSSNIRFAIASSDFVSLKIFDVLGREVATLVNETLEAGTYTAKWNATGVPSGMYFYRLSSGTNTETKKMVLLK